MESPQLAPDICVLHIMLHIMLLRMPDTALSCLTHLVTWSSAVNQIKLHLIGISLVENISWIPRFFSFH
jgi:hypothetical protein